MRSPVGGRLTFLFALLIMTVLLCSCGDDGEGADLDYTTVSLALTDAKSIPESISIISLRVAGPGMNEILDQVNVNKLADDETEIFRIKVPAGNDRTFSVSAVNEKGDIAYEGDKKVDLKKGTTRTLTIPLFGRGYIEGAINWLNPDTAEILGPLQNFEGTLEGYSLSTDTNGRYEIKLPTRPESYLMSVEIEQDSTLFKAFASVELPTGGSRVELNLFLFPDGDHNRPWVCAISPDTAGEGDTIVAFGAGFDPMDDQLAPKLVFNPLTSALTAENPIVISDDRMTGEVPAGTESGYVAVSWSEGAVWSNFVPFAVSK